MNVVNSVELHTNTHTNVSSDLPEGWALPELGGIVEVKYGKGLKKTNRISGPVPVYGSNGVVGRHNASLTQGPTIILGRKGTVGAVHFSSVPCWAIDTTYYVDEFNGLIPEYLSYALRSLDLADLDTSTAIPGLNRNDLYNQYIPLAPVAEQERIVAKVEELLTRVNTARERLTKVAGILAGAEKHVAAAAARTDKLTQAILARAFRGELVPTEAELARREGRSYEPASALLAKIEAQRKVVKPQRKRGESRRRRNQ